MLHSRLHRMKGGTHTQLQVAKDLEQWVKKMKCSGSSGIGIESFEDIKVGIDPSPLDAAACDCMVEGVGVHTWSRGGCQYEEIAEIQGEYSEGQIEGRARIEFLPGNTIDGYFVRGVLHGFARYFDSRGRLVFMGNHKNGKPHGTCWRIIPGGGCVVGRVDSGGALSGTRIAYIYPDYVTALVGVFKDGVMESGREAEVSGYVEDKAGIRIPIFSEQNSSIHLRNPRQAGQFGKGQFYIHFSVLLMGLKTHLGQ